MNNPNIPKSEKLKEAQRIMGNTFRAVETFTKFVKSAEFTGFRLQKSTLLRLLSQKTSVVEKPNQMLKTFEQDLNLNISDPTDSVDDDAKNR